MSNKRSAKAVQVDVAPAWEPLAPDELRKTHAYWRACNYLAAGMIYLRDNPLLRKPLKPEHIKVRLLGHWGASPGLSFTYVHLRARLAAMALRHSSISPRNASSNGSAPRPFFDSQ